LSGLLGLVHPAEILGRSVQWIAIRGFLRRGLGVVAAAGQKAQTGSREKIRCRLLHAEACLLWRTIPSHCDGTGLNYFGAAGAAFVPVPPPEPAFLSQPETNATRATRASVRLNSFFIALLMSAFSGRSCPSALTEGHCGPRHSKRSLARTTLRHPERVRERPRRGQSTRRLSDAKREIGPQVAQRKTPNPRRRGFGVESKRRVTS